MVVKTLSTCILIGTLVISMGCQSNPSEQAVRDAFNGFIKAIQAGDGAALYRISPKELKDKVDALYVDLSKLVEQVKREYPKAEVAAMLQGLAADLIKGCDGGKDLLISFLDFSAVQRGQQVAHGLEIEDLWAGEFKASVSTRAGETFILLLEDGAWRCNSLLVQLDKNPSLRTLRANMKTVSANLEAWKQATRETTDLSKPAGAFNIIAKAVRRGARVKVYELLNETSIKQLNNGAELVQKLQRAIEKKFSRIANRQAFLKKHGLLWIEKVRGSKALFAGLWDSGMLKEQLPLLKEVTIRAVRMKADQTAVLTVATGDGEHRFSFSRLSSGQWRLDSLEDVILREAVRKVEMVLGGLSTNH